MSVVNDDLPKDQHGNIDEAALKAQLIAEHQATEVKQTNFPTEIIDLPSKGLVYPEGHPLASGKIEMKYMTAREEDILSSANLIKSGVVIDKLLQSLIVTPVNYNDLLVGDKNAIMIAARVLGYGKNYESKVTCPNCEEEQDYKIDLTTLEDVEFDESLIKPHVNEFEFELPNSKRKIKFRLLNHGIDSEISKQLKAQSKKGTSKIVTTRLSRTIVSVDGNTDINCRH
jgi:hypothetical protein